jgi:hypothetical protein
MPPVDNGNGFVFEGGDNQMSEDTIHLEIHSTGDQNHVTLTLASEVQWWKGICENQWEILATQDDRKWGSVKFTADDINKRNISLFKAKMFGVHTHMYKIGNKFENGYEYKFTWKKD